MVDVVSPRTMPSDTEVHVARSFLTKILRSSMRKNDPGPRPRSWWASKLTEEESQPAGVEAAPPLRQPQHESRPKDETNPQRRLSAHCGAPVGMETPDRPPHAHPPGRLSPTGFGRFSEAPAAENIFFKGLRSEGPPPRYPVSGPVWQAPEKKKSQSPPLPPPPPPPRGDAFAAAKVFPFSEGPSGPTERTPAEKEEQNGLGSPQEARRLLRSSAAADRDPGKLSLSSNDVRQPRCGRGPAHQRQRSDESPLHAPPPEPRSVGSYYRSLQDLPANVFGRKRVRHSAASAGGPAGRRGEPETPHWGNGSEASVPAPWRSDAKAKYAPPPQPQAPAGGRGPEDAAPRRDAEDANRRFPDPWVPHDDHRISPLKTPLLHSLAQESRSLAVASAQDAGGAKAGRRGDRYATALRKEIQQKRAQLQKSRSAAALTCDAEDDEAEGRRSPETSDTYKDHLKEAQARVLQATSFQRRDLEPLVRTPNGRVGGRGRLPLAKRTHSFSEPDKMDAVGVEAEPRPGRSSAEPRKFSRPVLKPRDDRPPPQPPRLGPGRRLGTFAEYQATWSRQKKTTEARAQGRFRSAENILDAEETAERVHERSRSSPSADFYTQSVPPAWREGGGQQSGSGTRGKAENRPRYRPDRSPQPSPAPDGSPRLGGTSAADAGRGDVEREPEEEQPPPPPSSSSSSLLPFCSWTAALPLPAPDRARSPSPQFAPPRLTDEPPAAPLRSGHASGPAEVTDVNGPARKVPVRIVHAESSGSAREGRAYLPRSGETRGAFETPPPVPRPGAADRSAPSLFSAYTRGAARESLPDPSSPGARRSEEDAKREELARDIMDKDKSLVDVLDQSGRRTTMDLMEGLFPPEERILEEAQQRRRSSASSRPQDSSPRSVDRREEEEEEVSAASAAASLVPSSSYYNTSAPKAELLIKMKDMQEQLEEQDSEDELDVDLAGKKQELISSLARKLEVLREARQSLQEDVEDNETLGRQVEATVQRRCQPNQLDKFRMFVGDLDKVVSLLLSLSGRLARVENALNSLEDEAPPEEKRTLTEKRKLLMRQHEDAKELKENLDRRERLVSGIMAAHLDAESLDDYRHFVKMKSALIMERRRLEDKIKLGEEQLKCLLDSLPLEQRPPLPSSPLSK